MLSTVAGFSPGWVSVALVGYGLGTVAGNVLAGRVPPAAIPRVLPVPLAVLALVLLSRACSCATRLPRSSGLVVLGVDHLRGGPAAADLAHGAGRAGGGRADRGGEHLGRGDRGRARGGSRWCGARRRASASSRSVRSRRCRCWARPPRRSASADARPGCCAGTDDVRWRANVDRSTDRGARTHDHATRRPGDGTGHRQRTRSTEPADSDGDFLDDEWLEPRRTSVVTKVLVGAGAGRARVPGGRHRWVAGAADAAAARSAAGPTSAGGPGGGGGGGGGARKAPRTAAGRRGSGGRGRGGGRRRSPPARPRRMGWAPGGRRARRRAGRRDERARPPAIGGPSAAATPANAARPTPATAPPLQAAVTGRRRNNAASSDAATTRDGGGRRRDHRRPDPTDDHHPDDARPTSG